MERLQSSIVSVSYGNQKYPIGKSIFAVNLLFKLFRAAVVTALKSLHTLLSYN